MKSSPALVSMSLALSAGLGCTQPNPEFCGWWPSGCPEGTPGPTSGNPTTGPGESTGDASTGPTTGPGESTGDASTGPTTGPGESTGDASTGPTTGPDDPTPCMLDSDCQLGQTCSEDDQCVSCESDVVLCSEFDAMYDGIVVQPGDCRPDTTVTWEKFAKLVLQLVPPAYLNCKPLVNLQPNAVAIIEILLRGTSFHEYWVGLDYTQPADLCTLQQIADQLSVLDTHLGYVHVAQEPGKKIEVNQVQQAVLDLGICGATQEKPFNGFTLLAGHGNDCTSNLQVQDVNPMPPFTMAGIQGEVPPADFSMGVVLLSPLLNPLTDFGVLNVQVNTGEVPGLSCVVPKSSDGFQFYHDGPMEAIEVYQQ